MKDNKEAGSRDIKDEAITSLFAWGEEDEKI